MLSCLITLKTSSMMKTRLLQRKALIRNKHAKGEVVYRIENVLFSLFLFFIGKFLWVLSYFCSMEHLREDIYVTPSFKRPFCSSHGKL
ncbi:hypothetical protein RDI58_001075 [Solanum bulbocastanum]|uniref:Uncharacterized protein n=1 Tax=Solanum bulbocastanum TaxID=147425 RepID=A0AAN8UC29_SOLBU